MKKFLAVICAVVVLISGCGGNNTAEKPASAPVQQAEPAPPVAPAKVLNLGMTLEQFKQAYKKNAL